MAKKKVFVTPEPGDEVTMSGWTGNWTTLTVQAIVESKEYGPSVHGVEAETHRHVTLPLTHLVESGKATQISHGKWDVELPDGKVVRVKSKKAAQEMCAKRGIAFQEVSL